MLGTHASFCECEECQPAKQDRTISNIKDLVREALCTDGEHHKQWYLEEIGKICGMKIEIENRQGVDKGMPP